MFYSFKKLIDNQKVLPTHAGHSSLECPAPFSKFRPISWLPIPTAHVGCPEGRAPGWASPALRGIPQGPDKLQISDQATELTSKRDLMESGEWGRHQAWR